MKKFQSGQLLIWDARLQYLFLNDEAYICTEVNLFGTRSRSIEVVLDSNAVKNIKNSINTKHNLNIDNYELINVH